MKQPSLIYACTNCDAQSPKWAGRCTECGAWGSVEQQVRKESAPAASAHAGAGKPLVLSQISGEQLQRISTQIGEMDQVLGGGIVPGSLILIGGEPGIGKSSLLLQVAIAIAEKTGSVLYCSGEESGQQVRMRYERFENSSREKNENLLFLAETDVDILCATIREKKPVLAIVDSIQTIQTADVPAETGAVSQVRAATVKLLACAKQFDIPIIITGHVTKEGMVAGPKTLEHLVDTVLYLEGDANNFFRILKTVKNRFGSTNELGIFEMTAQGLQEIKNPSSIFLGENSSALPGTATTVVVEGSRAFLVQVQALTSKTYFGNPARRAVGCDSNRLQLLIAVLSKRAGLNLGDQDIHVNIVGGFKVSETAIDCALAAAIMSAYRNKPIPPTTVIMGEVGLGGEVRSISQIEKRLKEAEKLGFTHAILPRQKTPSTTLTLQKIKAISELEI